MSNRAQGITMGVLSGLAFVALFSWLLTMLPPAHAQLEDEAERPAVTRVEWDGDAGGKLITVAHEGHLWVVYTRGGLSHHPACPRCLEAVLGKQGPTDEERKFWQLERK